MSTPEEQKALTADAAAAYRAESSKPRPNQDELKRTLIAWGEELLKLRAIEARTMKGTK